MNIKECHVILDQSQRRISYVHLCKNTNIIYIIITYIDIVKASRWEDQETPAEDMTFSNFSKTCCYYVSI